VNGPRGDIAGNGKKLSQYIGSFWQLIVIGGTVLSAIAWGIALRNTIERNQAAVAKEEKQIEELQLKVSGMQQVINGMPQARELSDAIRSGVERNRSQDDRINEISRRLERLEQKPQP
jgi:hypothetical protein